MVIESGSRSSKSARRNELRLSENARVVLERRYLAKDDSGTLIETPEQLFRRVANNLAQAERNYGADEARVAEVEETFYRTLTNLDFLPNSPTLGNAGRPLQQLSACFVLPVEDSIDRIFDTLKATALVHQSGGGTGFAFSRLRPEGSLVRSTSGVASGPVSFMKVFDASTEAIKQGGTRRGANMGILSVDHPDIEKFIECKADMVTCTNFNISVAVTEKFMQAVERGEEYELVDPHTGKVTGTRNARAIFEKLVANAWQNGDPGIVFIDRINAGRANPVPKLGPIESTNPCVTGDTLIYTGNGLRRAAELAAEGTPLRVAVDGEQGFATASPVFRTGRKPVFRLHTAEGYALRLTADHRLLTRRGWVAAQELREGDAIRLLSHRGGFGTGGSLALGRLLGWLVGDGTFADDRAVLSFFGEEKRELAPVFAEMMAAEVPDGLGRRGSYPIRVEEVKGRDEARVRSTRFMRIAAEFGLAAGNKHQVPEGIFTGSEEMQRGFLQALFTADGHVAGGTEKGVSVRLTSISRTLLQDVQRLLLNFGIASAIYSDRRAEGLRSLPDGRGGRAEYVTSAYHDLVVAKDNLQRFASAIGFLSQAKQSGLVARLASYRRGPYKEQFYARFTALTPDGEEDVYDLTEPLTHSFVANGLVVHNCGEQPLYPYDSCNLGSLNLAKFVVQRGSAAVFDYERLGEVVPVCVRFLDNVIDMNKYPLPEIEDVSRRIRRIGLGVMGFADACMRLGIPYDSEAAVAFAEEVMGFIQQRADAASMALANERGTFPEWDDSIYNMADRYPERPRLRNATRTTIAPTGTLSIIADCSGGVEPVFALAFTRQHYLDRNNPTQTTKLTEVNDYFADIARREGFYSQELMDDLAAGGHLADHDEVPDWVKRVFVTAHDIAPEWHVRIQAAFQRHTDNAVSKCIAAGTLIPTSRGLIKIEDFAETEEEDSFTTLDYDISVDGYKVLSHYRAGLKPATKITLDNGASLTGATASHRVMTIEGWKRLGELHIGDMIVGKFVESHGPGGAPLPWESTFLTSANAVTVPTQMNPAFAALLGMLVADGHTVEAIGQVGLSHKNEVVERQFGTLIREVFGVSPKVVEDRRTGVRVSYVTSRNLVRFIEGLIGKGAYNKVVPDAILQGSAEEKLAFLRGITLDGYVTERGLCVYGGMSEQCAYHVAEICRSFGLPRVYQGTKVVPEHGVFHYVIVSDAVQALVECVEEHKNVEPLNIGFKVLVGAGVARDTYVPVKHEAYSTIRAMRQEGRAYCKNTTAAQFGWPVDQPVHRVTKIEDAGLVEMYDIEVADSHEYVVNGMVSHNTINFSNEATVEDVARAYRLAYEEGCLGITIYRDGSRELQVLSHTPAKSEVKAEATVEVIPAPAAEPARPRRERLPDERQSITHKFAVGEQEGFLTVGLYEDGRPGEIFIKVSKQGSTVSGLMDTIALLMSMAMQYGVPMGSLLDKLKNSRFEPYGMTRNPNIPTATSLVDYIARYLEQRFITGQQASLPIAGVQAALPLAPAESYASLEGGNGNGYTNGNGHYYNGKPTVSSGVGCPECGSVLQYAEGCLICRSCGYTKCG